MTHKEKSFRAYADTHSVAEKVRQIPKGEIVCCHKSLANKKGELVPETLLVADFVRLSESGKQKIEGVFEDEAEKICFVSSDIEYRVIYRKQDYFYTQDILSWYVTEDELYVAKGTEADKLRKQVKMERKLDKCFFVCFAFIGTLSFILFFILFVPFLFQLLNHIK